VIATRKFLSRRAILRGAGVAVALPLLGAHVPAFTEERSTAAAPARRLIIVEFSHGVVDDRWNPTGAEADFTLSESLAPLEQHRESLIVIRGLTSSPDRSKADFHDRAVASFLTGCEPAHDTVRVGTSMDQIAARELGRETRFASLELGTQPVGPYGGPCYRDAQTNLPMEFNPRKVFERLFGEDKIDPAAWAVRASDDASILDAVIERVGGLKRQLGAADRNTLDQYLDSIRDTELRIQVASRVPPARLPEMTRPAGIPDDWPEHVKLMFDMLVLALQADLTRVVTFALAPESSSMTFPQLGLSMQFHEISHHNNSPDKLDALAKINKHFSGLLAYFLDKLKAVQEPGGSLLDQSVVLYGSSLSNPSIHSQRDLPIIVAGGAAVGIKGGRYVRIPGVETPLTNLHLSLLDKVGVQTDKLGDSTGMLNRLEV
jgi:Protein of unknown function (DUF1552)